MAGVPHFYHLTLDGRDLIVVTDKQGVPRWSVDEITALAGQSPSVEEVPQNWDTWHLGYGYGDAHVPGGYFYADNMDCRWPGMAVMGPKVTRITLGGTATVSDFFEATVSSTTYVFVLAGRWCYRINADDTIEAVAVGGGTGKDFGDTKVATKAAEFDGNIYVGMAAGESLWEFVPSTATWTQGGAGVDALYWAKTWDDRYGNFRLWRAYGTNSVNSIETGANPRTGTYAPATPYPIGDTTRAITGLIATDSNVLFLAKTDGLYRLDNTGRNSNALQEVDYLVDSANGANLAYGNGEVAVPHIMGLIAYDPATNGVKPIHPGAMTGNRSPVRGIVTAQTFGLPWHYVALYNGTDTYLLAGRYPVDGEQLPAGWVGPKIWHPIAKLTGARCDAMHMSGLQTVPRLWFGYTVSTTYDVGYIKVPKSGDVAAELDTTNLTFAASGSLYLSPRDWGQPGAPKVLTGVEIENEGFSSSTYVVLYARIDRGEWQTVGRALVAGRSSLLMPSGNWKGHRVEYRLDVTNAGTTTTPKIKPIVAKAAIRPVLRDLYRTTVYAVDGQRLRNLGLDYPAVGQDIVDHLQSLREDVPVTLSHWWTGSEVQEEVLVHSARPTMIEQSSNEPAGYAVNLTMSVLRPLPTPWTWDGGTAWDSSAKWG